MNGSDEQMNMKNPVILLVEDNPDDVILTVRTLRKNNMTAFIQTAHDGVEAMAFLSGLPTDQLPELILLDLKLPRIDGIELLQWVRSNFATVEIPVIILTSSSEESDIIRSYHCGANSYLRKPVDFKELCKVANNLGISLLTAQTENKQGDESHV